MDYVSSSNFCRFTRTGKLGHKIWIIMPFINPFKCWIPERHRMVCSRDNAKFSSIWISGEGAHWMNDELWRCAVWRHATIWMEIIDVVIQWSVGFMNQKSIVLRIKRTSITKHIITRTVAHMTIPPFFWFLSAYNKKGSKQSAFLAIKAGSLD